MRILILGGTVFVGRAITDALLGAGHHVTHFNRGRSAPPDPRVTTVQGDRTIAADLARAQGDWDAVIDVACYLPQVAQKAVAAFAGVPRYVFVSTISVYGGPRYDEEAPLLDPPQPWPDTLAMQHYGGLKAACERVVRDAFADRATIVRPGLIVGPHDTTDRFTYWPVRAARGGEMLAPGRPSRTVQCIDVRDVGDFTARLAIAGVPGIFNATGPESPVPMETVLRACIAAARSDATLRWVPDARLEREGVQPWTELPLWIPESDPEANGFLNVPIARALAHGLRLRPLEATVADTLAWASARPVDHAWKAGMTAGREAELLRDPQS
jgi:2'-hydroxyisoflavone reductase